MPRILLNLTEDSRHRVFHDEDIERLHTLGELIPFDPKQDTDDLYREHLQTADAMLTCWGSRPLSAELLSPERSHPLLVAHSAGSVRGIVKKELLQNGVRLTQGAPAIAVAVAQYTVGLIVLALRQALHRRTQLSQGSKDGGAYPYRDLEDLNVGLVGLSRVGTQTALLLPPFGAKVLAYDPYCTPEKAQALGVELVADLDDLISRSDVLSLHTPVTDETRNLIDSRRIGLLRAGSVFINTARAALVDQDALFVRAMAGELEAYLDVTTPEPLPPDHPAWQSSHIFITPHIAGPTQQSMRRMARYAISEIERFLNGEPLQYEVTFDRYDILA
ncbi:MAG: hydroxyacid dehydrogenase [Armatimonadaceae bacterium]